MAEQEHLVLRVPDDQNIETMRPAVRRGRTYLYFRWGREPQLVSTSTRIILMIFKAIFCSLGLWSHRSWNYIPRLLFVVICAVQVSLQISFDLNCPYFDCNFNEKHSNLTVLTVFPGTRKACYSLFSFAALLSYVVFITSVTTFRGTESALVSPSRSMIEDCDKTAILWLFIGFVGFLSSLFIGLTLFLYLKLYNNNNTYLSKLFIGYTAVSVILAHWASVNTCHAFAVSSSSLGKNDDAYFLDWRLRVLPKLIELLPYAFFTPRNKIEPSR